MSYWFFVSRPSYSILSSHSDTREVHTWRISKPGRYADQIAVTRFCRADCGGDLEQYLTEYSRRIGRPQHFVRSFHRMVFRPQGIWLRRPPSSTVEGSIAKRSRISDCAEEEGKISSGKRIDSLHLHAPQTVATRDCHPFTNECGVLSSLTLPSTPCTLSKVFPSGSFLGEVNAMGDGNYFGVLSNTMGVVLPFFLFV